MNQGSFQPRTAYPRSRWAYSISAGRLRHRITFLHQVEGQDALGNTVLIWQPWRTIWAAVEPVSGREYLEARKIQSETLIKITCRYLAGVRPDMRIQFGDREFLIQSVIDRDERHVYLEIYGIEQPGNEVI